MASNNGLKMESLEYLLFSIALLYLITKERKGDILGLGEVAF